MKIAHCVECAASLKQQDNVVYICDNGHYFYNNAKAAVAMMFIKDDKLLFARRAHDPRAGKLDLPGGFVDPDETLEMAVVREAKEELGVDVLKMTYLASNPNLYLENVHTCDVFFVITKWSGELTPADDVASVEWHKVDIILTDDFAWTHWKPIHPKLQKFLADTTT